MLVEFPVEVFFLGVFQMPCRIKVVARAEALERIQILCTIAIVLPFSDVYMCCGNCWECCACTFQNLVESYKYEKEIVTSTFQSNRCW